MSENLNCITEIVEFYPSVNNFTLALLLMLVTNITSVNVLAIVYGLYSETPEVSKGSQKFILFTF